MKININDVNVYDSAETQEYLIKKSHYNKKNKKNEKPKFKRKYKLS